MDIKEQYVSTQYKNYSHISHRLIQHNIYLILKYIFIRSVMGCLIINGPLNHCPLHYLGQSIISYIPINSSKSLNYERFQMMTAFKD